jgi:hypothetical protein
MSYMTGLTYAAEARADSSRIKRRGASNFLSRHQKVEKRKLL